MIELLDGSSCFFWRFKFYYTAALGAASGAALSENVCVLDSADLTEEILQGNKRYEV
jgi:hypothetical protein